MEFAWGCSERRFVDGIVAAIIILIDLLLMKLLLLQLLLLLLFILRLLGHRRHGRRELNVTFLVQLVFELEEVGEYLVEWCALASDEVS